MNKQNTPSESRYSVSGSREGQVTVTDTASGETIRTFEMDSGVVVRETFLLEGGKIVAASQKDRAVFWDLTTGEEIRRFAQRIYGFAHDESKFFTFETPGSKVCLYTYPDLTFVCQLSENTGGPEFFLFSPDDRFLAIRLTSGFPSTDKNYPRRNIVKRGFISTKLFKIQDCQQITEFSRLNIRRIGEFSADSRYYEIPENFITIESPLKKARWRFDLTTYQIEEI